MFNRYVQRANTVSSGVQVPNLISASDGRQLNVPMVGRLNACEAQSTRTQRAQGSSSGDIGVPMTRAKGSVNIGERNRARRDNRLSGTSEEEQSAQVT